MRKSPTEFSDTMELRLSRDGAGDTRTESKEKFILKKNIKKTIIFRNKFIHSWNSKFLSCRHSTRDPWALEFTSVKQSSKK